MAGRDFRGGSPPPRFPPGFEEKTPYDYWNTQAGTRPQPPKPKPPPVPEPTPAPSAGYPIPSPDPEARAELAAFRERERVREEREKAAEARAAMLEGEVEKQKKSKTRTNAVAGGALVAALASAAPQLIGVVESYGEKAKAETRVAEAKLATEDERLQKLEEILEVLKTNSETLTDLRDEICRPTKRP